MYVNALRWSITLLTSGGGVLPRSALVSCWAEFTMALPVVMEGLVVYLCLNFTVSDPLIILVSFIHPQ